MNLRRSVLFIPSFPCNRFASLQSCKSIVRAIVRRNKQTKSLLQFSTRLFTIDSCCFFLAKRSYWIRKGICSDYNRIYSKEEKKRIHKSSHRKEMRKVVARGCKRETLNENYFWAFCTHTHTENRYFSKFRSIYMLFNYLFIINIYHTRLNDMTTLHKQTTYYIYLHLFELHSRPLFSWPANIPRYTQLNFKVSFTPCWQDLWNFVPFKRCKQQKKTKNYAILKGIMRSKRDFKIFWACLDISTGKNKFISSNSIKFLNHNFTFIFKKFFEFYRNQFPPFFLPPEIRTHPFNKKKK